MASLTAPHLFGGFFQLGYVTRTLDAAVSAFQESFGPTEFKIMDMPQSDVTARIALAYIDDVMIEIIQPVTTATTIYSDFLPDTDGPIVLHHLGYLVDDHQATLDRSTALGHAEGIVGSVPGVLDYSYFDTRPALGLWSEYIRLDEGGKAMFASVPRNRIRGSA